MTMDTTYALATSAILGLMGILVLIILRREKRPLGPMLTVPILGDTIEMAISDPVRFLFGRYKKYGSVFRVCLLGHPTYVVADWGALKGPYRDEGAKPEVPFPAFRLLMGDYNVLGNKDVHTPWRKAMLSTLGPEGLAVLLPRVVRVMDMHLREWEAAGQVQIFRSARRMGIDLSVDVVMDVELSPRVDRAWFKKQVEVWLDGMFALPLRLPGSALSRALAAKRVLLESLMREEEVARDHADCKRKWEETRGDFAAVLDSLTQDGIVPLRHVQRLGIFGEGGTELRDSAMSMLQGVFAAADTTRWALFNSWALLAMSPRVQDKLFAEQQQVLAEHGAEMGLAALGSMPYLEATLKECMRLMPATSGGLRRLTAPLAVGDTVIPAGSMIWLFSHMMHALDPALWDGRTDYDVPPHMDWRHNFEDAFRPERWLGGEGETAPKYYFTFGTSSHLCAGKNLAYLEIKVMLARVLRKYRLRLRTPDMLARCRFFPFTVPSPGTDTVLLLPREAPAAAA